MVVPASGQEGVTGPAAAPAGSSSAARIDTSVAHPARRYNYWLGGKDHFAADRESGDATLRVFPAARAAALANRAFMGRAVRFLAEQAGIRQFLDIGTGIPAPANTHEVAQAVAPETRVVYVDNDPIVMAHARALLTSSPRGATAYIEADVREHATILSHPDLLGTLDLTRPVGLMLVAILHFIDAAADPHGIVEGLLDRLPSGSYLVVSHATADFAPPELAAPMRAALRNATIWPRSYADVSRFFAGLELVDPGVVSVPQWRPDGEPELSEADASMYGGVARKP